MSPTRVGWIAIFALIASLSFGQIDKVTIAAGTPEDKDLTAIGNENDTQKKISMYQDFLQKYAANKMAVAYANWQLAQAYQADGETQKAFDAGDKALALSPRNMDILTSMAGIAQQAKDNAHLFQYAIQGGDAYGSIAKQTKPADVSDEQFKSDMQAQLEQYRSAYTFLETSAFNVLSTESDPKVRMAYIDKFGASFPNSGLKDQVAAFAMDALSSMGDTKRVIAYGEKALSANPDNTSVLLVLGLTYVQTAEGAAKAIPYAQKTIAVSKGDESGATPSNRVMAGTAHCILGRAYALQGKTLPSISELKTATTMLKGEDEQQYAVAAYFLGWNYAKMNKIADAKAILSDGAAIPGPMQAPIKDLLTKVNSAKTAGGRAAGR
jgi:tetratricopeptide (TPR) repeat protein